MLLATVLFGGSVVAVEPPVVTRAEQTQAVPAGGPVQDAMSAQRTARLRGAPVEVVGERTETSTTWANPDGSFRTELAAGPVWTKRKGEWLPVDPTLRVDRDGVRPKATGWQATFARARGTREQTTPLVSAEVDGHDVSIGWPAHCPNLGSTGSRPPTRMCGRTPTSSWSPAGPASSSTSC